MRGHLLILLAACGGSSSSNDKPDAPVDVDASIDAPGTTASCSFTEAADATNNTSNGAEATMINFTGTKMTICGAVNGGHFDAATGVVDVDAYKFKLMADADLLVHVNGSLGGYARAILQIGSTAGMQANLGLYEGDHGTLNVHLVAGEYVVAVSARNGADVPTPADYKVQIVADTPATRCPKATAAPSFTEANDGAQNNGNDMITIDETANPATKLTPANTDNPEPSNITANAGTTYRITGSSANVNPADNYQDRDTFLFTTGATTNQLSVRLNWASTTVDFDYKIFPPANVLSVAGGLVSATAEDEFQTFAVKPNTQYWLWVGAYDGATGLPATYDATLCAETYTP